MRKSISVILILSISSMLFLSACADSKTINGKEYEPYGILDQDDVKDPKIKYKVVWGNVVWGALLVETVVAPIVIFGFYLWEPEKLKENNL